MRHLWRLRRRAKRALRRADWEVRQAVREHPVVLRIMCVIVIIVGIFDIVNMMLVF